MTDLDLMTASGKGDSRAFGRLVERHHAAVTAVAFAVTRDLATASASRKLELSVATAQKRITRALAMITREIAERFVTTAEARRPPKAAARPSSR